MRRVCGVLVAIVCAAGAAVLTWPQLFHLERTFPIAQIVSFRGLLAVAFAGLMVVALLLALARGLGTAGARVPDSWVTGSSSRRSRWGRRARTSSTRLHRAMRPAGRRGGHRSAATPAAR